jgi:cell division protein FtsL
VSATGLWRGEKNASSRSECGTRRIEPNFKIGSPFVSIKNPCKNSFNSVIYSIIPNQEEKMTLLVILIIIAVLVVAVIAIYNKLVRLRNTVKSSWSDIDVQCKKRYDLVPNLVETVKGYASHERTVFEKVTEARSLR